MTPDATAPDGRRRGARPTIAYAIDPRFPGGTSEAVARELPVAARHGRVTVHAIESAMFQGRDVAPPLAHACRNLRLTPVWDAPRIGADLVILHNPAFLRAGPAPRLRIVARHLVVVTHENFLRPGGHEVFDVALALGRIEAATLCLRRSLAPVSAVNRSGVSEWLARAGREADWPLLPRDWFNICDMPFRAPAPAPRDRRGRLSRPGLEKFPGTAAMDLCFPPHAEANVILGADAFLAAGTGRAHWTMLPFRAIEPEAFFDRIDFMVYFTAPTLRESFGRAVAEAIAAGKVVITDPDTAANFGGGAVAATPAEVDGIVAAMIADPERYAAQVRKGQAWLRGFSAERFADVLEDALRLAREAA